VSTVVEFGHQAAVGLAGGGEFVLAFFDVAAQVEVFLLEGLELIVQHGDVGWRAEAGAAADLGAEQFRQPVFEAADVLFEAPGAIAEVGVVGLQRPAADSAGPSRAAGGGVFGGGDDRGTEVGVAVDERPVDAGASSDRGDGDLGGLGAHLGQGLVDALPSAGHVAAAGLCERGGAGHLRVTRCLPQAGWRACRG
jgi:hypothetical protein